MKKNVKSFIGMVLLLVLTFFPNTISKADTTEVSWTTLAPMSQEKMQFQTQTINGKIYAIGGLIKYETSALTEVYNSATNTWTTLSPMYQARREFQTEVINGKIYAIGGYSENNNILSTMEMYDPSNNTWTKLASMSEVRDSFKTNVINGKIYVIGGNGVAKTLATVEVYDPTNNTWTSLAPMSDPRYGFETEVINGKIYVIGGKNVNNYQSSAEVYDPKTNTWTKLASMSYNRIWFKTEAINGKIYAIGGSDGKNKHSSLEMYDPATNIWTQLASMSKGGHKLLSEVVNGKIYVMNQRTIEVYDPITNTWTSLMSPSESHNYGHSELINEKIYAIGGGNSSLEVYSIPGGSTTPGDPTTPETPTKLTATGGDSKVDLIWPRVKEGTSYIVKRSTSADGPYTPIITDITDNTYTDTAVTNGTIYYYIVTVIKDGSEIWSSNEASATPIASTDPVQTGKRALLVITMQNGERKEYDLTMEIINDFLAWYNSSPSTSPTYVIEKNYNKASFTSRKDYISFNQISSVEVNEYGN